MSTRIRTAAASDIEALVELNEVVQTLHVRHHPEFFQNADPARVREFFALMLTRPEVHIFLAELDGSAAGYVLTVDHQCAAHPFVHARRYCEIDQIVVRSEMRRRGIARSLLERAMDAATSRGIADIELTSWAFNHEAHAAFRALGFAPRWVRFGARASDRR